MRAYSRATPKGTRLCRESARPPFSESRPPRAALRAEDMRLAKINGAFVVGGLSRIG